MQAYSKICTLCKAKKDLKNFSKASREKDGFQHRCKSCNKNTSAKYRVENKDKERKRHKKYLIDNREKRNEYALTYSRKNKVKIREIAKKSYWNNRDKNLERLRIYRESNREKMSVSTAKWRKKNYKHDRNRDKVYTKNNPEKFNAKNARRRAEKLKATPKWADLNKIAAIYAECIKISKETGIKHHVDHDIPLRGKNVCGLHCENNLRIIPAKINLQKRNKFICQ